MLSRVATLILVLFAGAAFPGPAAERPSTNSDERAVADFYRGKVVRVVVGFPPGGGADNPGRSQVGPKQALDFTIQVSIKGIV